MTSGELVEGIAELVYFSFRFSHRRPSTREVSIVDTEPRRLRLESWKKQ